MNNKELSVLDYQKQWIELVDKACNDFYSLTRDERVWFTIQCLIQAVDDGGLISHYYNSGADYNNETIEDLIYLGFPDIADILNKINSLFPDSTPSRNGDERNEIISNWEDEKYDKLFDELDNLFFKREQKIEEALVDHINKKVIIN